MHTDVTVSYDEWVTKSNQVIGFFTQPSKTGMPSCEVQLRGSAIMFPVVECHKGAEMS